MNSQLWLSRGLQLGLGLAALSLLTSGLWGLLISLGDEPVAAVLRGVLIISASALVLDVVALVFLLTGLELQRLHEKTPPSAKYDQGTHPSKSD